ncbi:MAG TPA: nickel/cobalt transporter, partial [Bauldia sp.]|nr:nickel/cobalt transporter [Bauldia sp.]
MRFRRAAIVVFAFVLSAGIIDAHAATSPFGIATPDSSGSYFGGPLGSFFAWIAVHQAHFYKALTEALGRLKDDPAGLWLLLGLSFAYGVFHAVGPGHGKAVITSYLVASGGRARRGVLLSFMAAGVQAASAIVIVSIGAVVLRVSAMAMTLATDWIEVVSYGAITIFGAYLLWTKIRGIHRHRHDHPGQSTLSAAVSGADPVLSGSAPRGHEGHDHAIGPAVSPRAATWQNYRRNRDLRRPLAARGLAAVLAVGIRPCSGAIIILVFAL